MSSKKETKVLNCTVGGILKYPKKEGNTVKYALAMTNLTKEKLEAEVKKNFGAYMLSIKKEDDSDLYLLNVKTNYDIEIFDKDKNKLDDVRLYHGAEVYASIAVKEYTYMGRTGITAYLSGIVLLQNGEPTGQSFDSIMGKLLG